jgi:hypothetical protein
MLAANIFSSRDIGRIPLEKTSLFFRKCFNHFFFIFMGRAKEV